MKAYNKRLGLTATACIYAFIIMDNQIFYIFDLEIIYNIFYYTNVYLMTICVSFVMMVYYEVRYPKRIYLYTKWFIPYLIILSIVLISLVAYTINQYPLQKFRNTIQQASPFFVISMTVPLLVLFIRQGGTEKFMRFLNGIAAVWYVIILIQRYVLSISGSYLFGFSYYASENIFSYTARVGRILIPLYGNIMIIYNFVKMYAGILNKKVCKFNVILFILGMYCMIFIDQSRAMLLVIILSILVIILLGKKPLLFKEKEILLFFILLPASLLCGVIPKFIASFSTKGDMAVSTIARLREIQYFWECFCNNPLFGNGLSIHEAYSHVEHSNFGAWYCDVGIIGLMAHTGLCTVVIYIIPLVHMLKRAIQIYKKSSDREVVFFSAGIAVYMLASSATIIITDAGVFFLPIVFAYLEYHYVQEMNGQKTRNLLKQILQSRVVIRMEN